jgi:hypothetical protein
MTKLVVVTHTRRTSKWLQDCINSVQADLPEDARHAIIYCDDFESSRLAALNLAEYIAFVDDDDLVYPGALRLCLQALEATGAGVAFTDQEVIDASGKTTHVDTRKVSKMHIVSSPMAIHHLAVIRTSAVSAEVHDISKKLGVGVDWMIKASAALQHGAVHVPIIGYKWRLHPDQHSIANILKFNAAFDTLRQHAMNWLGPNSVVTVHNP